MYLDRAILYVSVSVQFNASCSTGAGPLGNVGFHVCRRILKSVYDKMSHIDTFSHLSVAWS